MSVLSPARRRLLAVGILGFALLAASRLAGQNPGAPFTVLSKDSRRTLAVTTVADQEFAALEDLAALFQLAVHEEPLGALTVSYKGRTIVLTPDQALVSVSGRLVSLPAAPVRSGRRWLVPIDFISRALAPIYDAKLDLRKPSRLLVVGETRVPRVAIRVEPLGTAARLTIDATPRATAAVAQEGDHLLIKFDADALDLALPPVQPQTTGGLVLGLRLVDQTTVAVDVGPRFGAFRASTQPVDQSMRVTLDIVAAQTESPAPAPASPSPSPSPTPAPPPPDLSTLAPPASSIRTIVIDAGHGGDDSGVSGPAGTKEKDLTLAVARRLKGAIEGRLGLRVLLTRDEDRNIGIDDRDAAANTNKADVFISLHASASVRPRTTGATIFIAAFEKTTDNASDLPSGPERVATFSGGVRDIELLPWDLAQLRHTDQSAAFARLIEQQFRDRVPLSAHPIDRGPIRLLEAANMPAVLVEIGCLSSPGQEKQLAGGEFQNAVVQAIVEAVVRFRDQLDAGRSTTAPGVGQGR